MPRYVTRSYVTDDPSTIAYLCTLDRTPTAELKATPRATVLHVSSAWSYWSDGKIIRRESVMREDRRCLSDVAVFVIDRVIGANSGQVEGGTATLVQVAEIVDKEVLFEGPSRGIHRRATLERWCVRLTDDSEADLYLLLEEYFEGYAFDVYWSRAYAERDLAAYGVTQITPAGQ